MAKQESGLVAIGSRVSAWVSDIAGHPFAQIGVITVCAAWFAVGLPTDILTAALSILAITLTQMVLNRQDERERDDRRRDVAMHAKLDELLFSSNRARDDMVGIEELDEEEIVDLKSEIKAAIDDAGATAGNSEQREVSKNIVDNSDA